VRERGEERGEREEGRKEGNKKEKEAREGGGQELATL